MLTKKKGFVHKIICKDSQLKIRTASISDLSSLANLENEMWPEDQRCSKENFINRIRTFSEGFLLAEDFNTNLVGTFFCVKRNFTLNKGGYTWDSESGYGSGLSHTSVANGLFGVTATVHPDAPKGTLRCLFTGWREIARKHGIKYIFGGSRIPGLISFNGTPENYLEEVINKRIFDPVLSKYMACDLKVGILLPNYFNDPESRNFGVEVFDVLE